MKQHASKPLAAWLVEVAQTRDVLTYGEAKLRLEKECNFSTIFSTNMGTPAGELMDRILEKYPKAPLLNVLLVKQEDKMPGDGAGAYLAAYCDEPVLAKKGARTKHKDLWRACFEASAKDAYEFKDWPKVFKSVFGLPYQRRPDVNSGDKTPHEKDGLPKGRTGEGPHHKALRLWVKDNPKKVRPRAKIVRSETEVDLLSGDRVDVVYYCENRTVALEVKSRDSNFDDLKRGIYQCIKYGAVLQAMDARADAPIEAVLVTEGDLPGYLISLTKIHKIVHVKVKLPGKR
ncbi:hypothetical protein [Acidocella sp.]|uniref:hypothetical protein n=1 Tax=Acidocella sp. TaxID=50710 RepID=UPI00262D2987|nr:hypothetical protein [Acidocella sp.]